MKSICSALLIFHLVTSAMADGIDIIGFDGQLGLQFQGSSVSNYYTLEFAPSLEGPWTNWGSVSSQPITGSVMSLPTPFFYRIKQIDPGQSSSYATGTPVYAESDPFWNAQKSSYATGTPLYAFTETDPEWNAAKGSYATGTPVYAESDPFWAGASNSVWSAIDSKQAAGEYTTISNVLALLGQYGLVPAIHVSGDLVFGSVTTGQTATAILTISNASGVASLTVTGITYPVCFSGAWSGKLAPGAATNITVTFAPTSRQDFTDVITVNSDAINGNPRLTVTGYGAPPNMNFIRAGEFVMGDAMGDGYGSELPRRTKTISEFYMDKYEVTKELWDEVRAWALTNGYSFGAIGSGKATNHPVQSVDWFDAIAWCNARSEREGLMPCYTNANGTIFKDAAAESFNGGCKWLANGYRLPTEAEWEKAARGDVANQRFPWGNTISHNEANYSSWWESGAPLYPYDVNPMQGTHPAFTNGDYPYTSPVGYFAPNGYGLYDMTGNVNEWCWDLFGENYYASSPIIDPRGPSVALGSFRVLRGGSWSSDAIETRVSARGNTYPSLEGQNIGFRCVRGL